MSQQQNGRPFILRSEAIDTAATPQDIARRATIVAELSEDDIARVSGAGFTTDIVPDWTPGPSGGGDHHNIQDVTGNNAPNAN